MGTICEQTHRCVDTMEVTESVPGRSLRGYGASVYKQMLPSDSP